MKWDVAVLGMGRVGYAAAYDLDRQGYKVVGLDISGDALKKASRELGIETVEIDPNLQWISEAGKYASTYAMALPLQHTLRYMEPLVEMGLRVVDATSVPEDKIPELEQLASRHGGRIFLYAGLAPGMAQTLAGAVYRELEKPEKIEIYVGGVPQNPDESPLLTGITFHSHAFFRQYNRPTRKRVGGEVVVVDPFDDIGLITLPGGEEYEYFLTDGLKSLLLTLDTPNLAEYTLRIPGHIAKMKFLRELGYLDWEEIEVEGCRVKPIIFTAELLGRRLAKLDRDRVVLAVYGYSRDVYVYYSYTDYDEELGLTAMQKTTGFNLSRFTSMMIEDMFSKDLMLPEYVGMDETLFKKYVELIRDAGLELKRAVLDNA